MPRPRRLLSVFPFTCYTVYTRFGFVSSILDEIFGNGPLFAGMRSADADADADADDDARADAGANADARADAGANADARADADADADADGDANGALFAEFLANGPLFVGIFGKRCSICWNFLATGLY